MMFLLVCRPIPRLTPDPLCTVLPSMRWKRSHTRSCSEAGTPMPSSRTETRAMSPRSSRRTSTGWSSLEYFSAFDRKLVTTCPMRLASAITGTGARRSEVNGALGSQHLLLLHCLTDHDSQVGRLKSEVHAATADARIVQNIIHQPINPAKAPLRVLDCRARQRDIPRELVRPRLCWAHGVETAGNQLDVAL